MKAAITPAPVRRSVIVKVPQAKAFETFAAGVVAGGHPLTALALHRKSWSLTNRVSAVRWYETGEDGSECEWGEVLVWEPPSRVVLAWRIGAD